MSIIEERVFFYFCNLDVVPNLCNLDAEKIVIPIFTKAMVSKFKRSTIGKIKDKIPITLLGGYFYAYYFLVRKTHSGSLYYVKAE